jgi:four helix bundle protein
MCGERVKMTCERFEDLPVWQEAIDLAEKVYELTQKEQFKKRHSLRDQIERAAVSVSNKIAEGFERGTTQELLTFLNIARGSAGEVRSMLCLLERLSIFQNLKFEISSLKSRAEDVSRQARLWADSLQDTEIEGQRSLNVKGCRVSREKKDGDEFRKEIERLLDMKHKGSGELGARVKRNKR